MRKRFWIITLGLNLTVVLTLGGLITYRYLNTQNWQKTSLEGQQSQIPPEFARNVYSLSTSKDLAQLAKTSELLTKIDQEGSLASQMDLAQNLLKTNKAILKKYHINGGSSYDDFKRLQLYLACENFLKTAYKKPSTTKVNELLGQLAKANLTQRRKINNHYLTRLDHVATDYNNLAIFTQDVFKNLGTVNKSTLTVKTSVTKSTVKKLLNEIDDKHLTKFNEISHVKRLLASSALSDVVDVNDSYHKEQTWKRVNAIFSSLSQSEYVQVGDLTTLADLKKNGIAFSQITIPAGYKLLDSSSVSRIYYQGKVLDNDIYILKNGGALAVIKPDFETPDHNIASSSDASSETDSSASAQSNRQDNQERTSSNNESSN